MSRRLPNYETLPLCSRTRRSHVSRRRSPASREPPSSAAPRSIRSPARFLPFLLLSKTRCLIITFPSTTLSLAPASSPLSAGKTPQTRLLSSLRVSRPAWLRHWSLRVPRAAAGRAWTTVSSPPVQTWPSTHSPTCWMQRNLRNQKWTPCQACWSSLIRLWPCRSSTLVYKARQVRTHRQARTWCFTYLF